MLNGKVDSLLFDPGRPRKKKIDLVEVVDLWLCL